MFIYSLPFIFTYTDLGSPFELFIIALILFIALLISAPFPDDNTEDRPFNFPLIFYFVYAWTGQLKLWQIFWPFFLLLNLSLCLADYAAKAEQLTVSSWDDVHFIFFFPSILWMIAVWRGSANSSSKVWMAYARLMTLAVFFEYGLKIVIRSEYSARFFNCSDAVIDFLTCF